MKQTRTLTAITLGFVVLAHCVVAQADDAQTLAKIDECLTAVQTFEYGQNGGPPTEMERIIFQLPADSPLRATIQQKLIDAIDGSNSVGRGVICRQLRVVGSDACVPAVAKLLADPELSQFARYALEGIGSPAAMEAMHGTLNELSGKLQIGIINSLSNSGYQPMLAHCVALLDSTDPAVVSAAVRALGRLGGPKSIAALSAAQADATGQLALDINFALLNCASMLLADGDANGAAKIYADLYKAGGPSQLAGLRGLVLAQPDKAADLLIEAIQPDDLRLAASAINLTASVKGEAATVKFVALLKELPPAGQVLMLNALGTRGDAKAASAMIEAIRTGDQSIQLAGLEALGGLAGNRPAVDALIEAAATRTDAGATVARASLARMTGEDVNDALGQLAQGDDALRSAEAIKALSSRDAVAMVPMLFALAKNDKPATRAAAIQAIGALGGQADIAPMVQLAVTVDDPGDLPVIETALGRALMRIEESADRATPLLAALPDASDTLRPILIKQLGASGTPEALAAVRAALSHSHVATADAAVAAMAAWPNNAVADDLIRLLESARTPELKTLALAGYLRIASESDDPTAMFVDVLQKVRTVDDKKLVLTEIGLNSESTDALAVTQSLLADRQLQATAAIAAIRIAYRLRNSQRDTARAALENVLAQVDHPDVQTRAQDVLNDMDKYDDHIKQWVAIGPFVDDKIVSGEQNYKTVFEPAKADTSDLQWEPITKGVGSWDINLEATYGAIDHCSAYLRTMVWSPIDQDVQVEGGCDDALRIWVNGALVFDDYGVRGGAPRTMLAPAKLRKGWNELKLKSVDHEGGWAFGCRIRKPSGAKLEGLRFEAR